MEVDHHRGHRESQRNAAQFCDDFGEVIFLEQPNGGDAGGARFQARFRIFESDSAQGQNWNLRFAGFAELSQSCGVRIGHIFLFEDRGEDREGSSVGLGLLHFSGRVAGHSYEWCSWRDAGGGAHATFLPHCFYFLWADVVGAEVDSIGSGGECDVGAGVDEKSRGQLPGARGQFAGFGYGLGRLAGQRFQFPSGEIFFP